MVRRQTRPLTPTSCATTSIFVPQSLLDQTDAPQRRACPRFAKSCTRRPWNRRQTLRLTLADPLWDAERDADPAARDRRLGRRHGGRGILGDGRCPSSCPTVASLECPSAARRPRSRRLAGGGDGPTGSTEMAVAATRSSAAARSQLASRSSAVLRTASSSASCRRQGNKPSGPERQVNAGSGRPRPARLASPGCTPRRAAPVDQRKAVGPDCRPADDKGQPSSSPHPLTDDDRGGNSRRWPRRNPARAASRAAHRHCPSARSRAVPRLVVGTKAARPPPSAHAGRHSPAHPAQRVTALRVGSSIQPQPSCRQRPKADQILAAAPTSATCPHRDRAAAARWPAAQAAGGRNDHRSPPPPPTRPAAGRAVGLCPQGRASSVRPHAGSPRRTAADAKNVAIGDQERDHPLQTRVRRRSR